MDEVKIYTYYDIKKGFKKHNKLYFRFLTRVFGVPLAYIAYKVGLSANKLTILAILLCAPAIYFNLNGSYIIAILFFHMFFLIDVVDGVLARGTNTETVLGEYLDDMAHYIFHTGFFFTFAVDVLRKGYFNLGILMVLFIIVNNLHRAHLNLVYKIRSKVGRSSAKLIADTSDHFLWTNIFFLVLRSFRFPNVLVWMTLLVWNFQYLKIYFICATFFSLLYYFYTFAKNLKVGFKV